MPATYYGAVTLGGALPTALTAQAGLVAAVNTSLPEVQARVAGLLNVQAALVVSPPDLTGTIAAVAQVAAMLQAAISGPTVTLQVAAIAVILAELEVILGLLQAQLAFAAALGATLGTAGIHMLSYVGSADQAGPQLSALLPPPGVAPTDQVGGVLLLGAAGAPTAALGAFCGISLNL